MTVRNVLERILSRAQLEVVPGRCLREYHRGSGCRLCLESCPAGAVSLGGSPAVDYSRCWCCGICANLCPTGAFQLRDPSYESLVARARGASVVEFGCGQLPAVGDRVIAVPCLGYLNEAVLVAVAAGGADEVRLDVSHCEQCRYAGGLAVSVATLRRANRLLSLFGLPDRVSAWTAERGSGGDGSGAGSDRRYSRREFLSYLGRGTRGVAGGSVGSVTDSGHSPDGRRGRPGSSLPQKRVMLLEGLTKLGPPFTGPAGIDGVPFARVAIGDDCDGCGMCVTFCPTGALAWLDEGERRILGFRTSDCLACGLCRDICPRDEISLQPGVSPGEIIGRAMATLKEYRTGVCSRCGQEYVAASASGLCGVCGKKDGLRRWLTGS